MKRRAHHRAAPTPGGTNKVALLARDIAVTVAVALVISFVLKQFLVQPFSIPSGSMQDTLEKGDRVLVSKLAPGPLQLHRGDVVVFKDPGEWLTPLPERHRPLIGQAWHGFLEAVGLAPPDEDQFLIKRIIGLGGDTVECQVPGGGGPGVLSVNGTVIDEPYLADGAVPCTEELLVTVPADALWVMGDNRQGSMDSRYHREGELDGAVDMDLVVGVATVRLAPLTRLTRLGLLRNPGATFAEVSPPKLAGL
jgi:signal peptidase I